MLCTTHASRFVKSRCCVIQVTAKFSPSGAGGGGGGGGAVREGSGNVPAMGLLWSQCINSR